MKKSLILLLSGILAISACKKNTVVEPVEQSVITQPSGGSSGSVTGTPPVVGKGSLKGIASPATAFESVIVTARSDMKAYPISVDPRTGTYTLNDLPEGLYDINFKTTESYNEPPAVTITIISEQTSTVEPVTAQPVSRSALMSCDINGITRRWHVLRGYQGTNMLQLFIPVFSGLVVERILQDRYALSLVLSDFKGAGTYICEPGSRSRFTYTIFRSLPKRIEDTEADGSKITVEITSYDAATRKVKATFSGTLGKATIVTKGVIDGTFTPY